MALESLAIIIGLIAGLIAIGKWITSLFNSTPDDTPDESGPDIEIELENCYYTVNDQPRARAGWDSPQEYTPPTGSTL